MWLKHCFGCKFINKFSLRKGGVSVRSSTDFLLRVFEAAHEKRNRIIAGLLVLSLAVFAGVLWQLRYTGITMTSAPICGIAEHYHTDECMEYAIIDNASALEAALAQGQVYVLTGEGYVAVENIEAEMADPQYDAYYQLSYICGEEEHIHTTRCYCDESADVEDEDAWLRTLPENMTGAWPDDFVVVAQSQLGYAESEYNFRMSDSGEREGYTRYGQWYSDSFGSQHSVYASWDSSFVSFCLYYSGISDEFIPYASGADSWVAKLADAGLYQSGSSWLGAADIVFFDTDLDGDADRVGIVESVNDDGTITVIEGDSYAGYAAADKVMRCVYAADDVSIFGYAALPEQPGEDYSLNVSSVMLMSADEGVSVASDEGTTAAAPINFSTYVTGATWKSFSYDKTTDSYFVDDFTVSFANLPKNVLVNSDGSYNTFYYNLPTNFDVADDDAALTYKGFDENWSSDDPSFTFTLEKYTYTLADGSTATAWRAIIVFNETYVNWVADNAHVKGSFYFDAYIDEDNQNDDGSIDIVIDGTINKVPSGQIKYPTSDDGSSVTTPHYDVSVSKSGVYDSASDEITYTIVVSSDNGTPTENLIELSDTLTYSGDVLVVLPITDFSVSKRVYLTGSDASGSALTALDLGSYTLTLPTEGSDLFSATLPQIVDQTPDGEADTEGHYSTDYVITYTVSLDDVDGNATYSPKNGVELKNDDNKYGENIKVSTSETITISKNLLSKTVSTDASTGKATWTIKVNTSGVNICGYLLSDDMMADVGKDNITISGGSSYEWIENEDGSLVLKFVETASGSGENRETYTITYSTDLVKINWNDSGVTNTATLDTAPDSGSTAGQIGVSASYYPSKVVPNKTRDSVTEDTENNLIVVKWSSSASVPENGIPAGGFLTDEVKGGASIHYMTYAQAKKFYSDYSSLKVGDSETAYTGHTIVFYGYEQNDGYYNYYVYYYNKSDNTWYRGYNWQSNLSDYTPLSDLPSDIHVTQVKILFTDGLNASTYGTGDLSFSYSTTIDKSAITTAEFTATNTFGTGSSWADAAYTYRDIITKTDGNGNKGTSQSTLTYQKGETAADDTYDNTVTWKVIVSIPDDYVEGTPITITDTLPSGVTLTGLSLVYNNYGWDYTGYADLSAGTVPVIYKIDGTEYTDYLSVTNSGGKVTLTVPDAAKLNQGGTDKFTIVYTCSINNFADNETYKDGHVFTLENNVSAKMGTDGTSLGSSSQTQEITKEIKEYQKPTVSFPSAKRSGELLESGNVKYTVDINPAGADIASDSNTITVTDKLEYTDLVTYIYYDQTIYQNVNIPGTQNVYLNSVQLYYAEVDSEGNPIYYTQDPYDETLTTAPEVSTTGSGYLKIRTDSEGNEVSIPSNLWSWTYDKVVTYTYQDQSGATGTCYNCNMSITLPDNTPAVLVYYYKVISNMEDNKIQYTYQKNTFTAADGKSTYKAVDSPLVGNSGGGESGTYTFTIKKVETGNYGKTLEGAVFTLYAYKQNSTSGEYEWQKTSTTFKTDSNGKIAINKDSASFEHNVAYYLVETKAPNGYVKPTDPTKHYFYFPSDSQNTEGVLPAGFTSKAYDFTVSTAALQIQYAENDRASTINLDVVKNWKDSTGKSITRKNGSIDFTLYQVASTVAPSDSISGDSGDESSSSTGGSGSGNGSANLTFMIGAEEHSEKKTAAVEYATGTEVTVKMYMGTSYDGSGWIKPVLTMNGETLGYSSSELSSTLVKFGFDPITITGDTTITGRMDDQNAGKDVVIVSSTELTESEVEALATENPWTLYIYIHAEAPGPETVAFSFLAGDDTGKQDDETIYDQANLTASVTKGSTYDMKLYLYNDVTYDASKDKNIEWGLYPSLKNNGETISWTQDKEDIGDDDVYDLWSYDFGSIKFDEDVAITGSLANSDITSFVLLFDKTYDEVKALARENIDVLYVCLNASQSSEGDESGGEAETTPSYTVGNVSGIISETVFGTYTITPDTEGNWKYVVENLPLVSQDKDGNTIYYSYYAIEAPANGWTPGYSNVSDGQIISSDGEMITITNTMKDTYKLPETGSVGTVLLTINAILFMAAPLMYLYRRREKKCEQLK